MEILHKIFIESYIIRFDRNLVIKILKDPANILLVAEL